MSEPFIGEIRTFGFNFPPRGWALCDGQLLPISSNTALFSLLGTIYGGDGRTTFALPDLRSRMAMHQGRGAGLSDRRIGSRSGSETDIITVNEMPSHTHNISTVAKANGSPGNANTAVNNAWSNDAGRASATYSSNAPTADMHPDAITATAATSGGGQATNNMPPYLVVSYCIALQGIFPSRS